MAADTEQLIDEILVMDAQTGSVKAMEALVHRWQKRLWRYAYDLTGRTDAASDVTQDGWLGIVRGIRRLHVNRTTVARPASSSANSPT